MSSPINVLTVVWPLLSLNTLSSSTRPDEFPLLLAQWQSAERMIAEQTSNETSLAALGELTGGQLCHGPFRILFFCTKWVRHFPHWTFHFSFPSIMSRLTKARYIPAASPESLHGFLLFSLSPTFCGLWSYSFHFLVSKRYTEMIEKPLTELPTFISPIHNQTATLNSDSTFIAFALSPSLSRYSLNNIPCSYQLDHRCEATFQHGRMILYHVHTPPHFYATQWWDLWLGAGAICEPNNDAESNIFSLLSWMLGLSSNQEAWPTSTSSRLQSWVPDPELAIWLVGRCSLVGVPGL